VGGTCVAVGASAIWVLVAAGACTEAASESSLQASEVVKAQAVSKERTVNQSRRP
jgi:hypothetical protein